MLLFFSDDCSFHLVQVTPTFGKLWCLLYLNVDIYMQISWAGRSTNLVQVTTAFGELWTVQSSFSSLPDLWEQILICQKKLIHQIFFWDYKCEYQTYVIKRVRKDPTQWKAGCWGPQREEHLKKNWIVKTTKNINISKEYQYISKEYQYIKGISRYPKKIILTRKTYGELRAWLPWQQGCFRNHCPPRRCSGRSGAYQIRQSDKWWWLYWSE